VTVRHGPIRARPAGNIPGPATHPRPPILEVEHGGVKVRARVRGADRFGCAIDGLEVQAPDRRVPPEAVGDTLRRQAERLRDRNTGLPERLKVHEVDPGLGTGVLRSRPDEMRGRRYSEVRLKGGHQAEVERYEYRPRESRRHAIPHELTHEALERLADDLAETVKG